MMPFADEARVLIIVGIAILILLGMTLSSISNEMEFERDCFQRGGIMKHTADGYICIKKDALLK